MSDMLSIPHTSKATSNSGAPSTALPAGAGVAALGQRIVLSPMHLRSCRESAHLPTEVLPKRPRPIIAVSLLPDTFAVKLFSSKHIAWLQAVNASGRKQPRGTCRKRGAVLRIKLFKRACRMLAAATSRQADFRRHRKGT
jgi:hypothetical protein